MAVYTHLGAEQLDDLIAEYNVGDLVSAKGIAEGVSNSNWLIETTQDRFILTMYERRIDLDDLPYFLGLLDHLSAKSCPVPRTIHDRTGAAYRMINDKAVALIQFLPGVSPTTPSAAQARSVGKALAQMHLASRDYGQTRENTMGFAQNLAALEKCTDQGLASIDPDLPSIMQPARAAAALDLTTLPQAQIHADLFPDNVLMRGDQVTGMIDFYFACTGAMALDLATTHAAWSFDPANGEYNAQCGQALFAGYQDTRHLTAQERELMPELAKGACLRFVASRAEDWLDIPKDAIVVRKDPMQFVSRWHFYDKAGQTLFA